MRKFHEENERIKRKYLIYLRDAKGRDEKTLDKIAASIRQFEESSGFKSFKKFHIEQASRFKDWLGKQRNRRTGKPLSLSTVDATLSYVKAFFAWLAWEPGYKSRIKPHDAEYFNNTLKNARAAHAKRVIPYPSMAQCLHAFEAMPERDEYELRDKALFAFFMLTGARDGAVASLRIKHVNLHEKHVFQDGRNVDTKAAKTIDTWFFPVDGTYLECLTRWMTHLREVCLFGPEDALFPKIEVENRNGAFVRKGFSRMPYASGAKLNQIIRNAFAMVQMPEYTPHSFRKTLATFGDEMCNSMQHMKAWSMNLGHEHIATTVDSYIPVSRDRQKGVMEELGKVEDQDED